MFEKRLVGPVKGRVMIPYDTLEELLKQVGPEKIDERIVIEPTYMTASAVGADIFSSETVTIQPFEVGTIPTGIKAKFSAEEGLFGFIRSSTPRKKGLILANGVGVIEADYYGNDDNDGNIGILVLNITQEPVTVERFERLGQLVLAPIVRFDNAGYAGQTRGASGSTDNILL